jgi:hypothetical protein
MNAGSTIPPGFPSFTPRHGVQGKPATSPSLRLHETPRRELPAHILPYCCGEIAGSDTDAG